MAELTPDNFKRLAEDVHALSGDIRELKGSVDGLKHAHNVLTGVAALVSGLFHAVVVYLGTQVNGLDARVDDVVAGLAGVQGELRITNQKLQVLEEIRDRINNLASVSPQSASPQDLTTPVAKGDSSRAPPSFFNGAVLVGDIDPSALDNMLDKLVSGRKLARVIQAAAVQNQNRVVYVPFANAVRHEAEVLAYTAATLGLEEVSSLAELVEYVTEHDQVLPQKGVLIISTDDPKLRDVANRYRTVPNR